jgi:maltose alpha-D-glucosyltransferase/alpha-amylase
VLDSVPELLPAFLIQQRWFGSKARTIATCEVEDWAALPGPGAEVVATIAGVSYSDAPSERYSLLLVRRPDALGSPPLGRLASRHGEWIVDGATDPEAIRALLRSFANVGAIPTHRGGILRYADASAAARQLLADDNVTVKAVGNEQSNTSVRVGSTLVFKLFRRLESGENPELEVARFLTSHTKFSAMAALEGSLTYVPPAGEPATMGILQTWIDNQGDGWRHVLAALGEYRHTRRTAVSLASDITRLGSITADFHAALESDHSTATFRPEPVQPSDIDGWSAQVATRLARARALTETQLRKWPDEARRLGASFLSKARLSRSMPFHDAGAPASFRKIRIHGDYHLGQVLKTRSGFVIIDFEGEPAAPITARKQKHCALRDVAGMLRSLEYAIETASDDRNTAEGFRMQLGLRESFLDGYLRSTAVHGMTSIPSDRTSIARWLAFFEFDKALYELEYEANNRPGWVHIPLRGILRILDARDS